jgi:hypothetical protein
MGKTRKPKPKRGRGIPLLVAGGIGYVMGAWHVAALRETDDGSAAQAVALRFPTEWTNAQSASNAQPVTGAQSATRAAAAAIFSPVPMAPMPPMAAMTPVQEQTAAQQSAAENFVAQSSDQQGPVQTASLENAVALPARPTTETARPAANPLKPAKFSGASARPAAANRSGYVLDDAQIASIKARLHLTPDQEQMWPAVEAALRNIAYKRTQQARERGATSMQADAFDPNAVQGLKSAAVPLIMSFNEEQKQEVRNIAHVMGLDQLATQF